MIYRFFEATAEKFISNLINLQVPKLKFERILVAVDHFVSVAAVDYEIHHFNKPGLPPRHPNLYEFKDDPRQVPLGEILLALSPKPVQIHEDYLNRLVVRSEPASILGTRQGVPASDFQVSAKLVTLALSFLAHIGCITVGYEEYKPEREGITYDRSRGDYGVLLAELHHFALTFDPQAGHDLLKQGRTFTFSIPYDYDYAWTALLRQVIAREEESDDFHVTGFAFARSDKEYTWDIHSEPYWCPVLRKDLDLW